MGWRGALTALGGAAVLAGAAPAAFAQAGGAVVITWHGDPATCAPAGLCDVSGSLVYRPGGRRVNDEELVGAPHRAMVARVLRGEPPAVCVDVLPSGVLEVNPFPPGNRLAGFASWPVGGRCAGPRFADVQPALPVAAIDPSRPGVLDLRGRRAFSAGPFTGEVISTLVVARGGGVRPARVAVRQTRRVRKATIALTYRVERVSGAVGFEFRGAADPACRHFDACGVTGRVTHTMDLAGRRLLLQGQTPLRGGRRPTLRAAFRAMRHGGLELSGGLLPPESQAQTAAEVARPGAATCRDITRGKAGSIDVFMGRNGLRAVLGLEDVRTDALDPVRTRCPGPTQEDVLRAIEAAGGTRFANRRLRLVLRLRGERAAPGYVITSRGALVIELRRIRARIEAVRR